jgi:hypothetical protein
VGQRKNLSGSSSEVAGLHPNCTADCALPLSSLSRKDIERHRMKPAIEISASIFPSLLGPSSLLNLPPEAVKRRYDILQRVPDQVIAQIRVCRFRQLQLLFRKFEILGQNLKRIVYPAVRAPSEYAINGVLECAPVADDFGLQLLLSVIMDGPRR